MDELSFQGPPEFYTDSLGMSANLYGFKFDFGLATESPGAQRTVATVRMSPQHALVMSKVLGKHLRAYQEEVGPISIPPQLLTELKLDEEG